MTRRDYELIAQALRDAGHTATVARKATTSVTVHDAETQRAYDIATGAENGVGLASDRIAEWLARQNPAFNRARFLKACGVAE